MVKLFNLNDMDRTGREMGRLVGMSWLRRDAHDKRQLMGMGAWLGHVHVDFGAMPQKIFIRPTTTSVDGKDWSIVKWSGVERRGGGSIIYRFLTVSREKAKTNHKFCGPIALANYAANK